MPLNTTLDINTPRGQVAAEDQQRAVNIVLRRIVSNCTYFFTPMHGAAAVDAVVCIGGEIRSVLEVKTREMTLEHFTKQFNREWLITHQKLEDLATAARLLGVPGYGYLYLKPSAAVLVRQLVAASGELVCQHRTDRTETKRTCNGGTANRLNAFVKMDDATLYR